MRLEVVSEYDDEEYSQLTEKVRRIWRRLHETLREMTLGCQLRGDASIVPDRRDP